MNVVKGEKGDKGDSFDAKGFLNVIYPVGSLFASSTNSCPIADYGVGVWEIVGTSLVTGASSVDYKSGSTFDSGYVCPSSGVIIGVHKFSDNGVRSLSINGVMLFETKTGASYLGGQSAGHEYQVSEGDIISFTNYGSMTFYPYDTNKNRTEVNIFRRIS